MHKVYKIVNNINNKFYIGITSSSLDKRLYQHCWASSKGRNLPLHNAIRKYGKEVFTIELLHSFKSREDACKKEVELIETLKPHYNVSKGGDGGS